MNGKIMFVKALHKSSLGRYSITFISLSTSFSLPPHGERSAKVTVGYLVSRAALQTLLKQLLSGCSPMAIFPFC